MSAREAPPASDVDGSSPGVQRGSGGARRQLSPALLTLAMSLAVVGVGLVLLSGAGGRGHVVSVTGHDAPINPGALNPADISAHNSPTIVANPVQPRELAVVSRIDTPFYSCSLHVSADGGRSWKQVAIPAPRGEEAKCFAPDVAFTADGTLCLSFVTLRGHGNVPHAVWVSRSRDGGRTLSTPIRVLGPLAFQVRLAADPVRPHRLYMTWLQASSVGTLRFRGPGNPIEVARSDNGGATWSHPTRVSSPARQRVLAPSPVVGPGGGLYVLYLDLGGDTLDYEGAHQGQGGPPYRGHFTLVLARSLDGGASWDESVVDDQIVPIQRFIAFLPATPSVAVGGDGRVYAAFHDARLGDPDVWIWSLGPGASQWTGPRRVNDTRPHDGTAQYLPKLAVAPNGRVDVLYYDRRADPRNVMDRVSLQSSFDAGKTFTPAVTLSSRPFDSRVGFGAREGLPDLGSRLGLLSGNNEAIGVWTDTRAGTSATQKQDLAAAVVEITERPRLSADARILLRDGGIAFALVGLLLASSSLARSQRDG